MLQLTTVPYRSTHRLCWSCIGSAAPIAEHEGQTYSTWQFLARPPSNKRQAGLFAPPIFARSTAPAEKMHRLPANGPLRDDRNSTAVFTIILSPESVLRAPLLLHTLQGMQRVSKICLARFCIRCKELSAPETRHMAHLLASLQVTLDGGLVGLLKHRHISKERCKSPDRTSRSNSWNSRLSSLSASIRARLSNCPFSNFFFGAAWNLQAQCSRLCPDISLCWSMGAAIQFLSRSRAAAFPTDTATDSMHSKQRRVSHGRGCAWRPCCRRRSSAPWLCLIPSGSEPPSWEAQ